MDQIRLAILAVFLSAATGFNTAAAAQSDRKSPDARTASTKPSATNGVGPAYLLCPGDELSISVVPQKAYDCSGVILPDGKIYLKGVGALTAGGLTIPQLEASIGAKLSEKLVAPRVSATPLHLHTAPPSQGSITVLGGVARQGALSLEAGLRVRKCLELAGGTLKNADLTRVVVFHKDLTYHRVDISTPEQIANPDQNRLLEDGDSVEIPLLPARIISVAGAVARPSVMDLEDGLRLQRALELAGGVSKDADLSRVTVYHKNLSHQRLDISTPELVADPRQNLLLADGDAIEVPTRELPSDLVRISGEVLNVGQFAYRKGMGLEDLIVAAGKLTPIADVEHIQLKRGAAPVELVNLREHLAQGVAGKVRLQPEDDIFIPALKDTVTILGAVPRAGQVGLKPGQNIVDFFVQGIPDVVAALDPARGDLTAVELVRAGKAPVKVNLRDALRKPDKKLALTLQNGDRIFVPPARARQPKDPFRFLSPVSLLMGLF